MAGFMNTNVSMLICRVENPKPFDVEALRKAAFTEAVDPEGRRSGWVGLGDMLDTENFFLAANGSRFCGFSFRMDARKPSGPAIRLQLAEKIKEEQAQGKKVGANRKKELKEAITAKLTSKAEFCPSIIDCIWDEEKSRLLIATTSEKAAEKLLELFKGSFGMEAAPIIPEKEMAAVFSSIQQTNEFHGPGFMLQPLGTASLATDSEKDEKASIAVQNSMASVMRALDEGMVIKKMTLVASEDGNLESQLTFTVDASLAISGLKLPKAEKGADEDAIFLINADICSRVADMVEALSR